MKGINVNDYVFIKGTKRFGIVASKRIECGALWYFVKFNDSKRTTCYRYNELNKIEDAELYKVCKIRDERNTCSSCEYNISPKVCIAQIKSQ